MLLDTKNDPFLIQTKQQVKLCSDSQNDSDKTKDTLFQMNSDSFLKCADNTKQRISHFLRQFTKKMNNICNGTLTSDKFVRLSSTIFRFIKNFQLISKLTKFDKLLTQISQLRRILRVNRMLYIVKDFLNFAKKDKRSRRDIFQIFFKSVMFLCDINDMVLYLMQLKVFRQRSVSTLKKNVTNLYFFQCSLWLIQHTYDYFMKQNQTPSQKTIRKINVMKYFMDALIANNDFSGKLFSIQLKNSSILGVISSIIGIWLIWK